MKRVLQIILGSIIVFIGIVFLYVGFDRLSGGYGFLAWLDIGQGFIAVIGGILVILGAAARGFFYRLF